MRVPGPPIRFLMIVLGLWIGGRATFLTLSGGGGTDEIPTGMKSATPQPFRHKPVPPAAAVIASSSIKATFHAPPRRMQVAPVRQAKPPATMPIPVPVEMPGIVRAAAPGSEHEPVLPRVGLTFGPPGGIAATPRPALTGRRWSGSAFLFVRSGRGGVPLAGGGQLGASQAGARLAYRLDDVGRIAAAARAYLPTGNGKGAEAALGIDLRPLPRAAFRLSVERRIAIGRDGRNAWSAYAAGGFFRGLPGAVEIDGYAQSGIVGIRSRDLFADGGVRIARRIDIGGGTALLAGAGAWGAAQPGVARIDAGPRVALRLPAGSVTMSIAGEWRARLAGDARPRSGPALTIAADF